MKTMKTIIPTAVLQEVMDAMDDMATDSRLLDMKQSRVHGFDAARDALRAALDNLQCGREQNLNMIQAGWKMVPAEPTEEMLRAGCGSESPAMFRESLRRETDGPKTVEMVEKIVQRHLNSYRAMLDAAPQPPTTEQSLAVQQPQGEQEPVAWIRTEWSSRNITFDGPPAVPGVRDELTKPVWTPLYTRPQREPLTDEEIQALWKFQADGLRKFARAIERVHGIGQEAAPQPPALGRPQSDPAPYLWYDPRNGDTWTQEAVDEGFCATDSLIPLYTKDTE